MNRSIDEGTREFYWQEKHKSLSVKGFESELVNLIEEIQSLAPLKPEAYNKILMGYVRQGLPWFSKSQLLGAYHDLCKDGWMSFDQDIVTTLQVKPTRSQAGVTVVTVLTKPYPCPGKCIFCPTDVRMPKSYLHDEPGAMRAERHGFDPYHQTAARLEALERIGHPVDKIELLILGGTWSSYRRDYQEWFVQRCLDAINGSESSSLIEAQRQNASGGRRNVGLVVETRPDHINPEELSWLRFLGVTKVQIGIQSLDDKILSLNNRGEKVQDSRRAINQLRLAGFKIHAHWMPNLLGATSESDLQDFGRLWEDPGLKPDELKIYPTMLVKNAELYEYWKRGEYQPYSESELVDLLSACKTQVPPYVRINRIIRDIPTTNVVEGNKRANLRQIVQEHMKVEGLVCRCIRCREVRRRTVNLADFFLRRLRYDTESTIEFFLSFESGRHIAGFLRLSLPKSGVDHPIQEVADQAMIREVHIYGPALTIGEKGKGEAQHVGLGSRLIAESKRIAREAGYKRLAVISAIGTREYYDRQGFRLGKLYMSCKLN